MTETREWKSLNKKPERKSAADGRLGTKATRPGQHNTAVEGMGWSGGDNRLVGPQLSRCECGRPVWASAPCLRWPRSGLARCGSRWAIDKLNRSLSSPDLSTMVLLNQSSFSIGRENMDLCIHPRDTASLQITLLELITMSRPELKKRDNEKKSRGECLRIQICWQPL